MGSTEELKIMYNKARHTDTTQYICNFTDEICFKTSVIGCDGINLYLFSDGATRPRHVYEVQEVK